MDEAPVRDQIVRLLGTEVLDASGHLVRERIAPLVFGPEGAERKKALEAIVHPAVRERLLSRLRDAGSQNPAPPLVVFDVPLLLEGPLKDACDLLLYIATHADDRADRARATRGWTADEVARREAHQIGIDQKAAAADFTISNTGTLAELESALRALLPRLLGAPPAAPARESQ